jgi:hypothetical protein
LFLLFIDKFTIQKGLHVKKKKTNSMVDKNKKKIKKRKEKVVRVV